MKTLGNVQYNNEEWTAHYCENRNLVEFRSVNYKCVGDDGEDYGSVADINQIAEEYWDCWNQDSIEIKNCSTIEEALALLASDSVESFF